MPTRPLITETRFNKIKLKLTDWLEKHPVDREPRTREAFADMQDISHDTLSRIEKAPTFRDYKLARRQSNDRA